MVRAPKPGPVSSADSQDQPAGPEDELGGVLGTGEGEQRLRDVVPDHLVVAAAQGLDQPPLGGQRGGVGAGQPSDRVTCTASRSPPEERAAIRAARRISVSPSGPPVSATTTRSRASQVSKMWWAAR